LSGIEHTIKEAVKIAKEAHPNFNPENIIGIGVDTTGAVHYRLMKKELSLFR
jgi:hypothetical protein